MKIQRHEVEALARCLLPEMQKYFESEEGKAEFEKWKEEQKEKKWEWGVSTSVLTPHNCPITQSLRVVNGGVAVYLDRWQVAGIVLFVGVTHLQPSYFPDNEKRYENPPPLVCKTALLKISRESLTGRGFDELKRKTLKRLQGKRFSVRVNWAYFGAEKQALIKKTKIRTYPLLGIGSDLNILAIL